MSITPFFSTFLLCLLLHIAFASDSSSYSNKWSEMYFVTASDRQTRPCTNSKRYRTLDGWCNNPYNPEWGASVTTFDRLAPNYYDNGINLPRNTSVKGGQLPSARLVSLKCHNPSKSKSDVTLMVMQWGQYLDHDITLTANYIDSSGSALSCSCQSKEFDKCFTIWLPRQQENYFTDRECLEFTRSSYINDTDSYSAKPVRQQLNILSSFIDGGPLYGNSEDELKLLRDVGGRLATTKYGYYPPKDITNSCLFTGNEYCFKTGDVRVNEHPSLMVLSTIFIRQHNLIADHFKSHTAWDDETIFQETRKIMEALLQGITYNEFLPIVLSENDLKRFRIIDQTMKWDSKVKPTIFNAFATAAFRFGHTLIPDDMHLDKTDTSAGCPFTGKRKRSINKRSTDTLEIYELLEEIISLPNNYFSPKHAFESFDEIASMLTKDKSLAADNHFSYAISRRLRRMEAPMESDLISLNIQRGRDHGLAPYNQYRQVCNLPKMTSLDQLFGSNTEAASVYKSIDDVDLFTGAMTEKPTNGSLLGPTFSCLIAYQFYKLKYGDRYFYLNQEANGLPFDKEQIDEINKMTLSKVMCATTKVGAFQPNAFLPESTSNPRTCCSQLPGLDLSKWTKNTQQQLTT